MSDFIDDDLLKDYFDEAFSQIDTIEKNILLLEKNTKNKVAIDSLFRAAHTLKGGSATVQMSEITNITHVLEDLMDEVRDGKLKINSNIIDLLLNALDIIKNMVNARSNGSVYDKDYSSITSAIKQIVKQPAKAKKGSKSKNADEDIDKDSRFIITEYDMLEINEANPEGLSVYKIIVSLDETNPMRTVGGIQIFTALRRI